MTRAASLPVRAVGRLGIVTLAVHTVTACYRYVPVAGTAPTGETLVLEITDQGRVQLGGSIGTSPLKVEGRLNATTDTSYTVAVRSVESVRGEVAPWTGEAVTIPRSSVSIVRVKRLDRARTALTIGSAVGAVAAFLLTRSLVTRGSRDPGETRPPGSGPGNS